MKANVTAPDKALKVVGRQWFLFEHVLAVRTGHSYTCHDMEGRRRRRPETSIRLRNMGFRDSYPPGTFCWIQHMTHDRQATRDYYGALFDWAFDETGRAALQERAVAGIGAPDDASTTAPPHWLSFVSVEDADTMVQKAEGLGAQILASPVDVGTSGRMAMVPSWSISMVRCAGMSC